MLALFSWQDLLNPLALFGFAGQAVFMMRFVWQWYVSEKRGKSTVPIGFWWLSLAGGVMLGVYAILRADPVFALGQLLGLTIYLRNLTLIYKHQSRIRARRSRTTAAPLADGDAEPAPDALTA